MSPVTTAANSSDHSSSWRPLRPRLSDLAGGLQVRRLLPAAAQRSVGPFVFFDHFGPVTLPAAVDSDIGPHPHIGLATLSYLFDGALLHRDSLGVAQRIEPGALNWMSAGDGIVHSERTPDDLRGTNRPLHGLQLWAALPAAAEQGEPSFQHVAADEVPQIEVAGARVRVLAGTAFGLTSPLRVAAPTLYLDVTLPALPGGQTWRLPRLADEMALYGADQPLDIDGTRLPPGEMAVLAPAGDADAASDGSVSVRGADGAPTRFVVIGGAPLDGPRLIWWNFVATERGLIDAAAERWAADAFPPVPGDEGPRLGMPARRSPG